MANKLKGVHWMLATPFNKDETVDEASIPNLVEKARESGCEGVVALGVMGEAHRLTDAEGRGVAEAVISAANGMPVTLGTSGPSTMVAIARTREAKEMGAAAVMVAPPPMPKTNLEAVYAHYYRLAEAVDIDLVVQDYPKTTGVHMPPEFFMRLVDNIPAVQYCKIEAPPTPPKIRAIKALAGDRLAIFGGLGGLFLVDELAQGASGAMTGFAFPETLVRICRHMAEGETEEAEKLFYEWLPLVLFEVQEGIDLSIRKNALHYRGLIGNPAVRQPGPRAGEATVKQLIEHIERLGF